MAVVGRGECARRVVRAIAVSAVALGAMWLAPVRDAEAQPLRIATNEFPASRGDPFTSLTQYYVFIWNAAFDSMTEVDTHGDAKPALAVSWSNSSPTSWRFRLRPGARFHNGEPLTADAVVNAVSYLISEEGAKNSGVVFASLRHLAEARKIDELTVEITTKTPAPILPNEISALKVPEPKAWTSMGRVEFSRRPVGTGPFHVTSWGDQSIEMSRFASAWRPARLDGMVWLPLPEPAARVQAFVSRQVDLALTVPPDSRGAIEAAGGRLNIGSSPSISVLLFNMQKPGPHLDRRVRLAMNHAINPAFLKDLLASSSALTAQPAPRTVRGHQTDIRPYGFDVEKGKALLKEAGVTTPMTIRLEAVVTGGTEIYQYVADNMKAIGISMEILPMTLPDLLQKMSGAKEFAAEMIGFNYGAQPSMDMMRSINNFHSCSYPRKWTCFPEIEPTIAAVNTEFDAAKRAAGLRAIARFYHDQAPVMWLNEQEQIDAVPARLKNYRNENYIMSYSEMELSR